MTVESRIICWFSPRWLHPGRVFSFILFVSRDQITGTNRVWFHKLPVGWTSLSLSLQHDQPGQSHHLDKLDPSSHRGGTLLSSSHPPLLFWQQHPCHLKQSSSSCPGLRRFFTAAPFITAQVFAFLTTLSSILALAPGSLPPATNQQCSANSIPSTVIQHQYSSSIVQQFHHSAAHPSPAQWLRLRL